MICVKFHKPFLSMLFVLPLQMEHSIFIHIKVCHFLGKWKHKLTLSLCQMLLAPSQLFLVLSSNAAPHKQLVTFQQHSFPFFSYVTNESTGDCNQHGLVHATGVHERNIVPMHEFRVSVNCTVLVHKHSKKVRKHNLGTLWAQLMHS